MKNPKYENQAGYTIAEMIVAMGIFLILISIASGSFVRILRTQRETVSLLAANGNASLAMEQISREIRTGGAFSNFGDEFHFTNSKNESVIYRLNSSSGKIERSSDGVAFNEITADNVRVNNLDFILFNGTPGDQYPTRITAVLQASPSNYSGGNSAINLQNTISARVLSN